MSAIAAKRYSRVRRRRTPLNKIRLQTIANSPNGLDLVWLARSLELGPQVGKINVDQKRAHVRLIGPDKIKDMLPGKDLFVVAHETLEQLPFGRGQVKRSFSAPGGMSAQVHDEVAVSQLPDIAPQLGEPTSEGAHTCQQFFESERLDHVVVGAAVEPGDSVFNLATSRQEQGGGREAGAADSPADGRPVAAGKHPVGDHHIVCPAQPQLQPGVSGVSLVDPEALIIEHTRDQAGQFLVIFDEQYSHCAFRRKDRRGTLEMEWKAREGF